MEGSIDYNQPVGYMVRMSKEETRLHILDTAIDLFWRASYHGVNMNDLSKVADVNKATVYQHFSSKEELATAAVERAADRTREFVFKAAFENKSGPVQRLRQIYQNVFQTHEAIYKSERTCLGCPFVNIGVELATSSDKVRDAVNEAFGSFRPFYEQIIRDADDGNLQKDKAEIDRLVSTLVANMNACQVASKLERRPEAILEGADRAVKILEAQ